MSGDWLVLDGVRVGSKWRRNPPGREVVEVKRVWLYGGRPTVRAHPLHGGRPLVAYVADLQADYTEEPA